MLVQRIVFSILLLFLFSTIYTQDFPKTIYELYNIEPGGCDFYDASGKFVEEEVMMEIEPDLIHEPPPPPTNADGKPMTPLEEFNFLFSDFKKVMASAQTTLPKNKSLKNGNYCYFENGKWGLKNSSNEVILDPMFDYVFPDTINGGFSGYQGATCNYYDSSTGKKQFKQDYYWIKSTEKNVYIVRSKEGFGLMKAGKTVIEPVKEHIKKEFNGQEIFYKVRDEKIGPYILRNDHKTQFPFGSWHTPRFAGKDFVLSDYNIYNLKTKKKLVCENGFYFKLISAEKQLAAIKKGREKLYYLIDFEGNIISNTAFSSIEKIDESGAGIAAAFDESSKRRYPPQQFGLINLKGEWIVQPVYNRLFQYKETGFWVVGSSDNLQGLIDAKGKLVIPIIYTSVLEISEGRYLCTIRTNDSIHSKIINARTGKMEKDGLDFYVLRPYKFCDRTLFIANVKGGELVLDKNYKPFTKVHQRILSEGAFIVGADFNVPDVGRLKQLYDCKGKNISLSINSKKVKTFQEIKTINQDLTYVYLKDNNTGYLVSKKGKADSVNNQMTGFRPSGLEGFFVAYAKGLQNAGMIDKEGNFVIPCKLDFLADFKEETGMACFGLREDMNGIVTSKGELLNGKIYQRTLYLGFGWYVIRENDKQGLINATGAMLLAPEYAYIYIREGMIKGVKNGNESLFDITGKAIN